ncbi:type II toxin-antitoxin system RelE/ParE family toxin [uncultured Enorma sp.]|uniref:type II toxin-antitoxin system RelE/ParE family toxin n=1 Tax=uncultured Enorma sp. TaxID=1714346 RepID=UPI00260AC9C3|nr:type II toxin-antitoxin system RelE/ParE family toxin [uncultured Enorma sp.]
MACSYVLLPRAQMDFENIVRYLSVELASPSAATRFVDAFEKNIALVCGQPEMYPLGRMSEVAARGYRVMPVMRYIVLYAHRDGKIVVAHIFHSLQDYARYV